MLQKQDSRIGTLFLSVNDLGKDYFDYVLIRKMKNAQEICYSNSCI